jgi:hypothetical protein
MSQKVSQAMFSQDIIAYIQIKELLTGPNETWSRGHALFWNDWSNDHATLSAGPRVGIGQVYHRIHGECRRRGWLTHGFYDNTRFYDTMRDSYQEYWPTLRSHRELRQKLGQTWSIPRAKLDMFITAVLLPSLNDWKE